MKWMHTSQYTEVEALRPPLISNEYFTEKLYAQKKQSWCPKKKSKMDRFFFEVALLLRQSRAPFEQQVMLTVRP